MLVVEKRCKVCAAVKGNKPLLKRIYDSSWFVPHSKDSLSDIAADYYPAFTYQGLRIHTKRHQFIDSQDYKDKMLSHVDKQAERSAVRKAVQAKSAIQDIIDRGHERLENGDITVDTNQLLRASQIQMAAEAKTKDQELAAMEMIAFFASGAHTNAKTYEKLVEEDS